MKHSFLRHFGLTVCALVAAINVSAEPIPDAFKQNGFAVGCQAYTFNRFSVFEAIEKTAQAGGKVIEFFPGQRLTADEPKQGAKVVLHHNAPEEVLVKVEAKLKQHGIKAVNYGVVGGKVIEFFPGQRLTPDEPKQGAKVVLHHNAPE